MPYFMFFHSSFDFFQLNSYEVLPSATFWISRGHNSPTPPPPARDVPSFYRAEGSAFPLFRDQHSCFLALYARRFVSNLDNYSLGVEQTGGKLPAALLEEAYPNLLRLVGTRRHRRRRRGKQSSRSCNGAR